MESNRLASQSLHLFGSGIAHSLSPMLFSRVFSELGLTWRYTCVECPDQDSFFEHASSGSFLAANVTMPYKPSALKIADRTERAAYDAGGANLLLRLHDGLKACNTDGRGAALFLEKSGVSVRGARVVVCGTGVTGRSIAEAMKADGAHVDMLSRSERTNAFRYGTFAADDAVRHADVVIDATPLGMSPADGMPFDSELLSGNQVVLDVVYGHGETELCCAARRRGCRFYDGRGMLAGQAAVALPLILEAASVPTSLNAHAFFDMMVENTESKGGV